MSQSRLLLVLLVSLVCVACGSDPRPSPLPYKADTTTVIGAGGSSSANGGGGDAGAAGGSNVDNSGAIAVATPDGTACVQVGDSCVKPQDQCGKDGRADVLVDESGAVVSVLCYPTDGVAVESFEGDVHDVGNNVVLVVDDKNDGVDVTGDVTIDGNNVTLYGYGPDVSVLGGDLHIDKNNALVRGVRIKGNVTIDKNNPALVDCVIEGDLDIRGNNVSLALCEVWGKLTIEGNNAILVANKFQNAPVITGKNLVCNRNLAFSDANGDHQLSQSELGAAIDCTNKTTTTTTKMGSGKPKG